MKKSTQSDFSALFDQVTAVLEGVSVVTGGPFEFRFKLTFAVYLNSMAITVL